MQSDVEFTSGEILFTYNEAILTEQHRIFFGGYLFNLYLTRTSLEIHYLFYKRYMAKLATKRGKHLQ